MPQSMIYNTAVEEGETERLRGTIAGAVHTDRWVAFRRLTQGSPREILFRARRAATTSWQRRRFRRGAPPESESVWGQRLLTRSSAPVDPQGAATLWRAEMERRAMPMSLSAAELADIAARYASDPPGSVSEIRTRAQQVSQRRFSLLGVTFQTPVAIPWQRDPQTGYQWPNAFFADVDLDPANAGADVRLVWELNRQQFLVDCGVAYVITGASQYASDAAAIVRSWIADNPYLQGVNWTSGLEAAMRVLNWLWVYQLCRQAETWPADLHWTLAKSLYQHADYIEQHLSFYSSPYNHLVGEATALFALGSLLPQMDRAAHWRRRGWSILCAQATRQFHADGASVEQSTVYHHFTLGFYLILLALCRRAHEPVPAELTERIERALELTMWMTRPDGRTPAIGDGDDGRAIPFGLGHPTDFRSLLAIGAALYRRADMKWVAGDHGEALLWLLGPGEFEAYRMIEPRRPGATIRSFPESGYAVLRTGWDSDASFLCFDAGSIAAGLEHDAVPSAAHGHADLLSFEACGFGVPSIVDPGCYTYGGDLRWHRYFRETPAHNTASVDGRSQARFRGRWTWSHAARPLFLHVSEVNGGTLIDSGHRGFEGLGGQVRHRRALLWCGRHWYVFDCFDGDGSHRVEIFFHLAPCRLETTVAGGVAASFAHNAHLMLQIAGAPLELDLIDQGDGPGGGWQSPSYGILQRAPILRFHGTVRLPLCVAFAAVESRQPSRLQFAELGPEPSIAVPSPGATYRLQGAGVDEDVHVRWDTEGGARVSLRHRESGGHER